MKALLVVLICSALTFGADSAVSSAHKATHRLHISSINEGSGKCSGTAVGPNALLTAAHCVGISRTIEVDDASVKVVEVMEDGLDHAIYLLDGITFTDIAEMSVKMPEQGDGVFIFGNPGSVNDVFRRGYVSGYYDPNSDEGDDAFKVDKKSDDDEDSENVTMYDLNGFFGDSGSGIFNDKGKVVGVISFVTNQQHKDISNKYMESLPIELSEFQWKRAKTFVPPAPKEEKQKEVDFDGFFTRSNDRPKGRN